MNGENKSENSRPVSPLNGQPVPVNPHGRPKGVPNKSTTRFKEALNQLFECNAEKMMAWLDAVDDPKDRFDILAKFVEVLYPKLARTEFQPLDKDGQKADMPKITIELVRPDANKNS